MICRPRLFQKKHTIFPQRQTSTLTSLERSVKQELLSRLRDIKEVLHSQEIILITGKCFETIISIPFNGITLQR